MNKAIDFYYSPTPNGWKVSIMLEECGLPYNTILINLKKATISSDFLKINLTRKFLQSLITIKMKIQLMFLSWGYFTIFDQD